MGEGMEQLTGGTCLHTISKARWMRQHQHRSMPPGSMGSRSVFATNSIATCPACRQPPVLTFSFLPAALDPQVLLSAKSLDQVHSATRAFFHDMCSFCNLWPPNLQRTRKAKMCDTTRHQIEELMDHALAAAAAAGRVFAARHKLRELQVQTTGSHIQGCARRPSFYVCSCQCHCVLSMLFSASASSKATTCTFKQGTASPWTDCPAYNAFSVVVPAGRSWA